MNCLLNDVLEAVRPHVNLTFDNILAHINTIYVLKTKIGALAGQGYLRLKVSHVTVARVKLFIFHIHIHTYMYKYIRIYAYILVHMNVYRDLYRNTLTNFYSRYIKSAKECINPSMIFVKSKTIKRTHLICAHSYQSNTYILLPHRFVSDYFIWNACVDLNTKISRYPCKIIYGSLPCIANIEWPNIYSTFVWLFEVVVVVVVVIVVCCLSLSNIHIFFAFSFLPFVWQGQMLYIAETDLILFQCYPSVMNLDDLTK